MSLAGHGPKHGSRHGTNFNQLSWLIIWNVFLKHQSLTPKHHCFLPVVRVVLLSWLPSYNSYLSEYSSILVSSLNMILFQASASQISFLFDQLNLAFKCFLVNAFSSCSRRMCLVVSTDTKLDESYSSITCLAVFFGWAFDVQTSFRRI